MSFAAVLRIALIAPALVAGSAPFGAQGTPVRYARIAGDGARVLNLADEKGVLVTSPAKGTLVAVHEETITGWSAIEVPGGFPVWVFGAYLGETSNAGTYEVTGNGVNLRPRPSSDTQSFPLPQRLSAGTHVQAIERPDAAVPLKKAWVHVWSPPGIRAWIRSDALAALAGGEDGKALWDGALASAARVSVPSESQAVPANASRADASAAAEAALQQELDAAREKLKEERAKPAPDYPTVRRALEALLVKSPTGPVAIEARNQLQLLATLEKAAAIEADLEREREGRREKVRQEQEALRERSRAKDPLGDAFLARGVLSREQGVDGKARYWISLGGKRVAEALCSSGRYALDQYAGYDVGVQGIETDGSEPLEGRMRIEVTRLEVLGRR